MKALVPLAVVAMFVLIQPGEAQRLALKTYTRSDGLVSDYVMCMFQDNAGRIWFGTDRGLSCYDGRRFTNYTMNDGLPSNFILCIYQDRRGDMWLGTYDGGATVFDGRHFRSFSTRDGLSSNHVTGIWQDEYGRMFFLAKDLSVLKDSTLKILRRDVQGGYGPLADGSFLVAKGQDLARMICSEDSVRFVSHALSSKSTTALNPAEQFRFSQNVINRGGEYWVPSYGRIFGMRFGDDRTVTVRDILPGRLVTSCQTDGADVWVTTDRNGVAKVSGDSVRWFSEQDGFSRMRLMQVIRDYEGSMWFGTQGGGAQRLLNEEVTYLTTDEGLLQNDVTVVFPDSKNRLWIGSSRGVDILESGRIRPVFPAGMENVRAFAEDDHGRMFIGSFSGLYGPMNPAVSNKLSRLPYQYISYGISALVYMSGASADAGLWASTFGDGITRVQKGNALHVGVKEGLPTNMFEGMVRSGDAMWLLTRSRGATRYRDNQIETFSRELGLPSNMVNIVYEEIVGRDTIVWFGTDKGVARLQKRSMKYFDESSGMRGNNVIAIFQLTDTLRTVVIATDEGLNRFRNGIVEPYGPLMILPSREMKVNSTFFDKQSSVLWVATSGGLVRVDPTKQRTTLPPPRVIITKMFVDTMLVALDKPQNRTFSYDQNNLVFEFAGLSFADEQRVRYRYSLAGVDDGWSAVSNQQSVQYRNLPEGLFEFSVVAVNPDGVASSIPASVSFRILPPFWRTWWFRIFVLLAIAGGFGTAVRYISTRELRKKVMVLEREQAVQKERERISRDLHDHVGAQLVNIISGLDLVSKYSPPTETRAQRLLRSLQQDARLSMLQLRETIWAIKSQAMTLGRFSEQVENYSRRQTEFYDRADLEFTSNCDDSRELSPSQVLNCFRITQEALTNCMKHSNAKTICVRVMNLDGALSIEVADNGSGFRPSVNAEQGNGIRNMIKRADEIGAKLTISQPAEGGTSVCLRLPLHAAA